MAELDNVLRKVACDLKMVGTPGAEFLIITNEVVMDAVTKLINLGDKIKKVGSSGVQGEEDDDKPVQKLRTLQDFALNRKKA